MTRRPFRTRYRNPAEEAAQRVYALAPGFYAVRETKDAVEVGMLIAHGPPADPITGEPLDRSWYWTYTVNGEPYGDPTIIQDDHAGFLRYQIARPIDKAAYDYLIAHRKWAKTNAPDRPEANIKEPVDFNKLPPLF